MRDIPLTTMLYLEGHNLRCYSPTCQHGDGSDEADVLVMPARRFRLGDLIDTLTEHLERYEREPVIDLPDLSEPVA